MSKVDHISELKQTITELFSAQKLAVLSSYGNEQPYASLVAFAVTDDLNHIIFPQPVRPGNMQTSLRNQR